MKLTPTMQKFILHWGEMGWRWGINRSVAQVHALLMLSPKPLPADEICETLNVARSNVSTSLKELQGWGLVRIVHEFGDRILPVTLEVADIWGRLDGEASLRGTQLPIADALIAATAIVHDLTVVTRNVADFERCGARVLSPWTSHA